MAVDQGGTFTDCIVEPPGAGAQPYRFKILSSPTAIRDALLAAVAAHQLGRPIAPLLRDAERSDRDLMDPARLRSDALLPPCEMRIGTTIGTNALLTGLGGRALFLTTRGFEDQLRIGFQDRPDLFALRIERPEPGWVASVGVTERIRADGSVETALVSADVGAKCQDRGRHESAGQRFHLGWLSGFCGT
jgi:5-oxoprolinase (ATP-hydrolysing)